MTKRTTKPFSPLAATTPPSTPPRPTPRFEETRETAEARWRSSGPTSEATNADWLGCRPPLPSPAATAAEVDDLERHHAAPAEVVQEDAELDDPQGAGQAEAQPT